MKIPTIHVGIQPSSPRMRKPMLDRISPTIRPLILRLKPPQMETTAPPTIPPMPPNIITVPSMTSLFPVFVRIIGCITIHAIMPTKLDRKKTRSRPLRPFRFRSPMYRKPKVRSPHHDAWASAPSLDRLGSGMGTIRRVPMATKKVMMSRTRMPPSPM